MQLKLLKKDWMAMRLKFLFLFCSEGMGKKFPHGPGIFWICRKTWSNSGGDKVGLEEELILSDWCLKFKETTKLFGATFRWILYDRLDAYKVIAKIFPRFKSNVVLSVPNLFWKCVELLESITIGNGFSI